MKTENENEDLKEFHSNQIYLAILCIEVEIERTNKKLFVQKKRMSNPLSRKIDGSGQVFRLTSSKTRMPNKKLREKNRRNNEQMIQKYV